MTGKNSVILKMEEIREVFLTSKNFASQNDNVIVILNYLKHTNTEFRSIAYEAVSMVLALKDLSKENSLDSWKSFKDAVGSAHEAQIHVGLGWALAQENRSALPLIKSLQPLMRYRVLDGAGYYNGMFKRRHTIVEKRIPDDLDGIVLKTYYQGIGRSIWYLSSGDIEKAAEMISSFDDTYHQDLWRGLGIAVNYVGGFDEKMLHSIFTTASRHQSQLVVGAALATRARLIAKSLTNDIELLCKLWFKLSANEVKELTEKLIPSSAAESEIIYEGWISAMESEFRIILDKPFSKNQMVNAGMSVMAQ